MAPNNQNTIVNSGVVGENSVFNEGLKQFISKLMDEKLHSSLADIHRTLDNLGRQIAGLCVQQQAVQNGNNRGQVGSMTRVKFLRFNGEDVRDWVFRCDQFFFLDE